MDGWYACGNITELLCDSKAGQLPDERGYGRQPVSVVRGVTESGCLMCVCGVENEIVTRNV